MVTHLFPWKFSRCKGNLILSLCASVIFFVDNYFFKASLLPYLNLFYLACIYLCICVDACINSDFIEDFVDMSKFCYCFRAGCSMWCHGWWPCLVLSSAAGSLTSCCPKVSIITTVLWKSLTIYKIKDLNYQFLENFSAYLHFTIEHCDRCYYLSV